MGTNNCKKTALFARVMMKTADDFDAFLSLERVAKKREAPESICQLYAGHSTCDRFVVYEAKICTQRKGEAKARQCQIAQNI